MSRMNSRQRKLSYGAGILLLLAPIVYLGFPSQQSGDGDSSRLGLLSQKRRQYELGEATLGNVDPSSSAVNLVLLGLRGPAATWLHVQAIEHQERKEWAKLRSTVDSIILLQPHYVQIWKFQGWNLAYNVSREWDKVDDRFYWVKEGIKFLQEGTRRNQSVPILFHDVGDFVQNKMGVSDEKKFFREYFEKDPDPRFETAPDVPGPDPAINPNGLDSYLVAHDWFVDANQKDDEDGVVGVRGMTHVFFRQGPSKALINFAGTRAQKGLFDEHVPAWDRAYKSWMDDYGRMDFYGLDDKKYRLNSTEDDLKTLAEENGITVSGQRQLWAQNLDMTNFRQCATFPIWSAASRCWRHGGRSSQPAKHIMVVVDLIRATVLATCRSQKLKSTLKRPCRSGRSWQRPTPISLWTVTTLMNACCLCSTMTLCTSRTTAACLPRSRSRISGMRMCSSSLRPSAHS